MQLYASDNDGDFGIPTVSGAEFFDDTVSRLNNSGYLLGTIELPTYITSSEVYNSSYEDITDYILPLCGDSSLNNSGYLILFTSTVDLKDNIGLSAASMSGGVILSNLYCLMQN